MPMYYLEKRWLFWGAQLRTASRTITLYRANINCSILRLSAVCDVFICVRSSWLCCYINETDSVMSSRIEPTLHWESSGRMCTFTFFFFFLFSVFLKQGEKTNASLIVIILFTGVIIKVSFPRFLCDSSQQSVILPQVKCPDYFYCMSSVGTRWSHCTKRCTKWSPTSKQKWPCAKPIIVFGLKQHCVVFPP